MITRRNVLHGSLLATAGAAVGRINPDFFFTSAHAQEGRTMRFLGAEALTGNWDPTTHTNLGQLIVEGFVFGYLTRAPMSPDNPEELIYELATEMNSVDEYTLEVKLREGVKFHDGTPFTVNDAVQTLRRQAVQAERAEELEELNAELKRQNESLCLTNVELADKVAASDEVVQALKQHVDSPT